MLWTSLALSCSLPRSPLRKTAREGVLTVLATLINSLSRGTPSVTFFAPTPAKWKVFKVICVAGSPTLCAARTPTVSPGKQQDLLKRCLISPSSQSKDCFVRFSFCRIFLEASAPRKCALRMTLAFSSTARPMVSPSWMPRVTSSVDMSWFTLSTISPGVYRSFSLPLSSTAACILARPSSRVTLIGMCCFESPSMNTSLQMSSFRRLISVHSASSLFCISELDLMASSVSGFSHALGFTP
mmetsp:Transcript_74137/g.191239  ORF Transcript_74137/g.191239 Transcript_74137/m.191239 type:complete len:241 (+) Transcript_74137:2052-2774(+)